MRCRYHVLARRLRPVMAPTSGGYATRVAFRGLQWRITGRARYSGGWYAYLGVAEVVVFWYLGGAVSARGERQ